jgi:hypothetical protein
LQQEALPPSVLKKFWSKFSAHRWYKNSSKEGALGQLNSNSVSKRKQNSNSDEKKFLTNLCLAGEKGWGSRRVVPVQKVSFHAK